MAHPNIMVDLEASKAPPSLFAVLTDLSGKLDRGEEPEDVVADFSLETITRLLQEAVVASAAENPALIEFLLKRGAAVNYRDPTDPYLRSTLHHAVERGLLRTSQLLLQKKWDVNALCVDPTLDLPPGLDDPDFDRGDQFPVDASCLMLAGKRGNVEITELLLKNGADLSYAVEMGIADFASDARNLPMLKCLACHGADFTQMPFGFSLSDELFLSTCINERTMRKNFAYALQGYAVSGYDEYQRSLDCLKFVLSKGAPSISPAGIASACANGDFGTLCQVYYNCIAQGRSFLFPDEFPAIEESSKPFLISSGPDIMVKMLRNWPPAVQISEEFLTGLEKYAGVTWERTGITTLKKFCLARVRSCLLTKGKEEFFDRLNLLRVPEGLKAMICMKQLSDRLDKETLFAKRKFKAEYEVGICVKSVKKCMTDYLDMSETLLVVLETRLINPPNIENTQSALDWLLPLGLSDVRQHFARIRNRAQKAWSVDLIEPIEYRKELLNEHMMRLTKLCAENYPVLSNDVSALGTEYLNAYQQILKQMVKLTDSYSVLWDRECEKTDSEEQYVFRTRATPGTCPGDIPVEKQVLDGGTSKKREDDSEHDNGTKKRKIKYRHENFPV